MLRGGTNQGEGEEAQSVSCIYIYSPYFTFEMDQGGKERKCMVAGHIDLLFIFSLLLLLLLLLLL